MQQSESSGDTRPGMVNLQNEFKSWFYIEFHPPRCEMTKFIAQLDTASVVNVISQDTVENLNMSIDTYSGAKVCPLGEGEPIQPIGQLKLRWNVRGKKKTYTTTFLVLDKNSSKEFDVLIGEGTIGEVGFWKHNDVVWLVSMEPEV